MFDVERLAAEALVLRQEFESAEPFPHLMLDGFVNVTSAETFPTREWNGWRTLGDRYQQEKYACDDISIIPEPFRSLIHQLSEPAFLRALESATGIEKLVPDPYLTGGGLHLSGPGGILSPHTDFHYYRALGLYRRINVLLYFNEGWSESDGGCLSLYADAEAKQPVRTVVPEFGRAVIFRTDDGSVHGFPQPVGEGKYRRSVALYYYTADEAGAFSGDETTYWREHGKQTGIRKVRFIAYRTLLNLSRGISIAAHIVNPNQGMGLVRSRLAQRRKSG